MTIRRFEHEERGGQPGDIYYAIELREYRFVQFERLAERTETAVKSVSIAKLRPDDREIPGQYTVRTGDYLIAIAARVYGDSSRWREIYEANRALIGPNPNVIQPGQTLVIPNA